MVSYYDPGMDKRSALNMPVLRSRHTYAAQVRELVDGDWRLELPAGPDGSYRLAQLDDYSGLPRRSFLWQPPARLGLRARISSASVPGTWGFGFWNDPFGLGILQGSQGLRLPALPNAAWFFYASPENYLSFQDHLPASGLLAATFRAVKDPASTLTTGLLSLPLLPWRPFARWLRRVVAGWVPQSAVLIQNDPCQWHTYRIDWQPQQVTFWIDGGLVSETYVSPAGPLACVLWIDNQYVAWLPDGRLRYGTLANAQDAWLEVGKLVID